MSLSVALDTTPLAGPRSGIGEFVSHVQAGASRLEGLEVLPYRLSWRRGGSDERWLPYPGRLATRWWRWFDVPSGRRALAGADVVHATNYLAPPTGLPTVITVHDCTLFTHPEWVSPVVRSMGPPLRRAIRRGAWVHTPTEHVGQLVRSLLDTDRVAVIPHGRPLMPTPTPTPPRGLAGRPYVVGLGTIEPRKNLPRLVRAFGIVRRSHPELRLVLAGSNGLDREAVDREVAALPSAAADDVVITGWLEPEDRTSLLAGARALAYPSLEEGFGLPLLEAMTVGVPVVTSNVGALTEVAGDAALIVEPTDVHELADAIGRAAFDPAERARLVSAGARRVTAFDWQRSVESLAELYRTAVESCR